MTGLAGGAADKLGNNYEHWWLTGRVADLLDGVATRLRLEPPGEDGIGIEFEIDIDGVTWGEQVKDHAKPWTVVRLRNEGVLRDIKHQLDRGRRYRFITSSAATELGRLCDRSRQLALDEFERAQSAKDEKAFAIVVEDWATTREEAWALLPHVTVEQHSVHSLRQLATRALRTQFLEDPEVVAATIREFCDRHLHETVTAPQVAAHLQSTGLTTRRLAYDDRTLKALHRTVERHRRRVDGAVPTFGLLERPEAADILSSLRDLDGPPLVVMDGGAGLGKSAVAANVASQLESEGWFVAVARMDHDTTPPTSIHLGEQMGLDESPSVLLGGVADGSSALLIIDQLDAVSTFSGRRPDGFDAIEEALEETEGFRNLRVLLVCRTVDLESDHRLRRLMDGDAAVRHTLALLDRDAVEAHLAEHGVAVVGDDTIELLRTPLHLSVYERLSPEGRGQPYRTLQDLYGQLTHELRRGVESRVPGIQWATITSALVDHMSDREILAVQRNVLNQFPRDQVAALESEAVLASDGDRVSFFHESYFDYLFAETFVASGKDLHDFLVTTGQFLFRRAQTRQVLEYLAATDRAEYRRTVVRLISEGDIRSHIKHLVVEALRGFDPTAEDWAALEDVAWSEAPISPYLLSLLSIDAWFEAADSLGRWELWLADRDRAGAVAHQLTLAARHHGARVAELTRPYINDPAWSQRYQHLIAWSMTADLVPLAVEVITQGHVDDARGPIAINSDFWSIVYSLAEDSPEGAARLTGAWLRRGLSRAIAAGSDDPFSDIISTDSQTADILVDIGQRAPSAYVEEVLPFVVDVAKATSSARQGGLPGGRWRYQFLDGQYGVDALVFHGLVEALRLLAKEDPVAALESIAPLRITDSFELRLLASVTLAELNDADDAIGWLLDDPLNLELGWADSSLRGTRIVIENHSGSCSDEMLERLEAAILAFRIVGETGATPYSQYELLSGVDQGRLSDMARQRLGELERKYPGARPSESLQTGASWVGSPILKEQAQHMSDGQWLRALRKHNTDQTTWTTARPVGGASQLASVLGELAQGAPERFARLALQFDDAVPAAAFEQVLRRCAPPVDNQLALDLCLHAAASTHGDDPVVGRAICETIGRFPLTSQAALDLLERYAASPDPQGTWAPPVPGSTARYEDDLEMAGYGSTRGQAALAIGQALTVDPDSARLLTLVEALAVDPHLGVRAMAANPVHHVVSSSPSTAFDLAERLFDPAAEVLQGRHALRLLMRSLQQDPQRFAPVLAAALRGSGAVAEPAGQIWAVADLQDIVRPPVPTEFASLSKTARIGAAKEVSRGLPDMAYRLADILNDPEPDVRAECAAALRRLGDLPPEQVQPVLEALIGSPGFDDLMEAAIDGLEALGGRLPEATLRVCAAVVKAAGRDLGDIRTSRAASTGDLVRVLLRAYRQGSVEDRTTCLNIIDDLADLGAFGLSEALDEER